MTCNANFDYFLKTPGDAFQAEDRVRRIGQTKPVKSIWIKAFFVDEVKYAITKIFMLKHLLQYDDLTTHLI